MNLWFKINDTVKIRGTETFPWYYGSVRMVWPNKQGNYEHAFLMMVIPLNYIVRAYWWFVIKLRHAGMKFSAIDKEIWEAEMKGREEGQREGRLGCMNYYLEHIDDFAELLQGSTVDTEKSRLTAYNRGYADGLKWANETVKRIREKDNSDAKNH